MTKMFKPLLIFAAIAVTGSSCKKYLDVQPKSTISEEQLFESEIGFQQALVGVYSQLASRNLYGDNLTMGFVSALAQNYAVAGTSAPFVQTRALDYSSAQVINYTNNIWLAAYSAIAGANKVIINSAEKKQVLTATNYALVRGEALGIRALLHFELLRLFGPEFQAGRNLKAIPYKTTVDQFSLVPSTTEEVINLALKDLDEAAALLKDVDPITFDSPNRRIKFNYYAVKALEARIRMYMGDGPGAFSAAQMVTSSGKFPFVTSSAASSTAGSKDRLFITELVFCLRVPKLIDWVDGEYFKFRGSASQRLTRSTANFNTLFETAAGGGTDFRFLYGLESDFGTLFPSKFWQTYQYNTTDSNRLDQLVPVIRLSEMYYIMAETAPTITDGIQYLNIVRQNRGLGQLPPDLTPTRFRTEITKEHQKEFYAEGQLFFYYKRNNVARMQFMTTDIPASKYVLPIPDLELENNPNYN